MPRRFLDHDRAPDQRECTLLGKDPGVEKAPTGMTLWAVISRRGYFQLEGKM